MDFQRMTQTRVRAWLATIVWTISAVGFFLAYFSGGGPSEFDTDSRRHLAAAAAIAFGFAAYWSGLWLTRKREGQVVADERDFQVVARASQATLIVVLVIIFLMCTLLWLIHEAEGVVDVGWMWFLAYGCMLLALVTNAVFVLILDRSTNGRG